MVTIKTRRSDGDNLKRASNLLGKGKGRLVFVLLTMMILVVTTIAFERRHLNSSQWSSTSTRTLPATASSTTTVDSAIPWKDQPVLSSRGVALPIPEFNHSVPYDIQNTDQSLRIVTDSNIHKIPRADGDEAMQYILSQLDIGRACRDDRRRLVIVDVGGLYGDFGLSTAARGCQTIIFEPQRHHAEQIARSVLLNDAAAATAKVHWAAVSPKDEVSFVEGKIGGGTATVTDTARPDGQQNITRLPTEQLDRVLDPRETILFLKVDVEGNEDDVWKTAKQLFRSNRILHAVFEYTPYQFRDRGTEYSTFLPRLYQEAGARQCYALHRLKESVYRIPKGQEEDFYRHIKASRTMQTDIYCMFGENEPDVFEATAPIWTPQTDLRPIPAKNKLTVSPVKKFKFKKK